MEPSAADRSLLRVALLGRCPRCGEGSLYRGLLAVADRCTACGLDLSRQDAGDGAAVFVILVLGALVVAMGGIFEHVFHPPLYVHALVWTPVTFAGAVLLLRWFKAALIAQEFRMRSLGGLSDQD